MLMCRVSACIPLKGDRKGFWSATMTRNHRIVFRFAGGHVHDVDLIDYH